MGRGVGHAVQGRRCPPFGGRWKVGWEWERIEYRDQPADPSPALLSFVSVWEALEKAADFMLRGAGGRSGPTPSLGPPFPLLPANPTWMLGSSQHAPAASPGLRWVLRPGCDSGPVVCFYIWAEVAGWRAADDHISPNLGWTHPHGPQTH